MLLLLSGFYIPGALDPHRYIASAFLAVAARFAGFAFFVLRPTNYPLFGYFDLLFAVPECILLCLFVSGPTREPALFAEGVRDANPTA